VCKNRNSRGGGAGGKGDFEFQSIKLLAFRRAVVAAAGGRRRLSSPSRHGHLLPPPLLPPAYHPSRHFSSRTP